MTEDKYDLATRSDNNAYLLQHSLWKGYSHETSIQQRGLPTNPKCRYVLKPLNGVGSFIVGFKHQ